MPAYKKGTEGYYKAQAKRTKTMKKRYGGAKGMTEFYQKIGKIGGLHGNTGGFHANPSLARAAGAIGGSHSWRGHKLIKKNGNKYTYVNTTTGKKTVREF